MMQTSPFSAEHLSELETLTHRYARYSRSAGGLASVLGGVFCLVSYLVGGLLPVTLWVRAVLVALPILWLLIKQLMVRYYYQRLGHVEERETCAQRRNHRFRVSITLLVAILVTATVVIHDHTPTPGMQGYLALVWLLVLAAWRWLRSPLDFIVGVFLFCQAALLCAGHAYPVIGTAQAHGAWPMALVALMFPLVALGMIAIGVRDHRHFLNLRQRMDRLRTGIDA